MIKTTRSLSINRKKTPYIISQSTIWGENRRPTYEHTNWFTKCWFNHIPSGTIHPQATIFDTSVVSQNARESFRLSGWRLSKPLNCCVLLATICFRGDLWKTISVTTGAWISMIHMFGSQGSPNTQTYRNRPAAHLHDSLDDPVHRHLNDLLDDPVDGHLDPVGHGDLRGSPQYTGTTTVLGIFRFCLQIPALPIRTNKWDFVEKHINRHFRTFSYSCANGLKCPPTSVPMGTACDPVTS